MSGKLDQISGKVKETAGEVFDDSKLKADWVRKTRLAARETLPVSSSASRVLRWRNSMMESMFQTALRMEGGILK